MYTAVIRSICVVGEAEQHYGYTQLLQLTRVKILVCIVILGEVSNNTLEINLYLLPFEIYIECTAAKSLILLRNLRK